MRRYLPRSLFGQLMLVLAGGLVLAQLLSAALHLVERDSVLARASGMQPAQRIADIVKLLDSLGPAERERIVRILSVPPLVVSLDRAPAAPPPDPGGSARAQMFSAMLQSALGDDRPVFAAVRPRPGRDPDVAPPEGPMRKGMGMGGPGGGMPMHGPGHPMPEGPSIVAQVRLLDGTWARFDSRLSREAASLPWRLLAALGVLLAAVLLLSWWAVRRVTRPLEVLANAADELGRDIHRPPLPLDGPAELRRAAVAFNTMQSRLAALIEERTRTLAAISHDLKTPITRMRLRADLLEDERLREKFEKDLLEMEALVTQALAYMRGLGDREPVQLVDVMGLLESVQADNAEMGRTVTIEGRAAQPYAGMPRLLARCIGNLVDNAVLYGSRAEIRVAQDAAGLRIRIRDHGPGIPAGDREKVFEPFFRLEGSRSRETGGTGLGLGIARDIARLHGGDVTLHEAEGGGLEVLLALPAKAGRAA